MSLRSLAILILSFTHVSAYAASAWDEVTALVLTPSNTLEVHRPDAPYLQEGRLRHILNSPTDSNQPYCTLKVSATTHSVSFDVTIGTLILDQVSSKLVQGTIYTTFHFIQAGDQPSVLMVCLPARRNQHREITLEEFQGAVEGETAFEITELSYRY